MNRSKLCRQVVAGLALSFSVVGGASAGVIVGGSSILNTERLAVLEGWLGEGALSLSNIFTKDASDSSRNSSVGWHAAVDGKGRTFTLFEVSVANAAGGFDQFVYGGYNPYSWNASGAFHIADSDAERTAFIFNLTTGVKLVQCKSTYDTSCGFLGDSDGGGAIVNAGGKWTTFNDLMYGPTFGNGFDLFVDTYLSSGRTSTYSYGYPEGDYAESPETLLGSMSPDSGRFTVGALETFTIAAYEESDNGGTVPEPSVLALLGVGLLGLVRYRRKLDFH